MIKYIQIYGERRSGTNYLASLIRRNFRGVVITTDFGGKHWFVKDHFPRGKPNRTTDNQCRRRLTDSSDTLFIVIYKNPYDWLRSINKRPFHGDGHWGLGFSEFIRKPWVSYTTEKLHPDWEDNPENYYFIEEARHILDLRTQKINHFTAMTDSVENICFLNYESLVENVDILEEIAKRYDIGLKRSLIVNDPYRAGSGKKERVGFVPEKYNEIGTEDLEFIEENLDWDVERSIGYNPDDDKNTPAPGSDSVFRQKGLIKAKSTSKVMNEKKSDKTNTDTAAGVNELEITVHIKGLDPLELVCSEDQAVVETLFRSLIRNRSGSPDEGNDIVYLQVGSDSPKAIYFPSSHLVSIETHPPVSQEFLERLSSG